MPNPAQVTEADAERGTLAVHEHLANVIEAPARGLRAVRVLAVPSDLLLGHVRVG